MKHTLFTTMFILLLGLVLVSGCIRIENAPTNQDTNEEIDIDTDTTNNDDTNNNVDLGTLYDLMQQIKYETDATKFAQLQTQLDLQVKPYAEPYINQGCSLSTEGNIFCPEDSQFSLNNDFNCYGALVIRPEGLAFGLPLFSCLVRGGEPLYDSDYFFCTQGRLHACQAYVLFDLENDVIDPVLIKNNGELISQSGFRIDTKEKAMAYALLTLDVSKDLVVDGKKIKEGSAVKNGEHFIVTVYQPDQIFGCYDTINYMELRYSVAQNGDLELIPEGQDAGKVVYTNKLDAKICVD